MEFGERENEMSVLCSIREVNGRCAVLEVKYEFNGIYNEMLAVKF